MNRIVKLPGRPTRLEIQYLEREKRAKAGSRMGTLTATNIHNGRTITTPVGPALHSKLIHFFLTPSHTMPSWMDEALENAF